MKSPFLFLAAVSLSAGLLHAQQEQVLYRNIFSCNATDENGAPANSLSTSVHWDEFRGAEAKSGATYSVAGLPGKPEDVENVNSSAETYGPQKGFLHPGVPPHALLLCTPSAEEAATFGEIDPKAYGKLVFRWYGGAHIEGISQRLAVQIGGANWYVAAKPLSPVVGWAPLSESGVLNTVEFSPAAAEWRELVFSPDSELRVGDVLKTDLPAGPITNFGILAENSTGEENVGIVVDTFEVAGAKK